MKLKTTFIALLTLLTGFVFMSCDKDDDVPADAIPQAVVTSLQNKFPGVTNVKWEIEDGYLVAEFSYGDYETEAWFDRTGKWFMTETDLPYALFPDKVKEAFESSKYASWKIDDTDRVVRADSATIYVIEVELAKEEYELHYTEDGTLVLERPDTDDDHHEYWP